MRTFLSVSGNAVTDAGRPASRLGCYDDSEPCRAWPGTHYNLPRNAGESPQDLRKLFVPELEWIAARGRHDK